MQTEPRRLQVLFFTNLYPTPVEPSFAVFNAQLARELKEICDLTLVCPLPWFPRLPVLKRFSRWYAFAEVPREYELGGMTVYSPKYLMLPRVSGAVQGVLVFLGSLLTVWRLHRKKRFDIINSLWLYPDAVAAGWMAKLFGIPTVPTALGCDVNRMLNESEKRGQILAMLKRAPGVIVVSEALRESLVSAGIPPAKIATVQNGVNGELFFERNRLNERAALGLPNDRQIILFVGRLSEEKGLHTLIEAVASLRRKRSNFLLVLVGDGPLLSQLESDVKGSGLVEHVRFAGRQHHHAVANWLGACDVFCLPSLREGCPNVVIEALSSGRPVVASRVGGIPAMVRESTGILVEPQDVQGFSDALEMALSRSWNEAHIAASMKGNSWRATAEQYLTAYRNAVSFSQKTP